MNKIEQIRQQIIQGKRKSIFTLAPLEEVNDFLPPVKRDRNQTVDSESNFSLFPLITITDDSRTKKSPSDNDFKQSPQAEKVQLRPFLKEKRGKKPYESSREWKGRGRNESVENVTSMMARSCVPSIRINRVSDATARHFSRTQRVLCVQARDQRTASLKLKPKRSPTKSPTKRFRRLTKTRRTVSPRKVPSPTRKFSISAWEISGEELQF